jgi:transcriptional regulator with XRE-family HTH domain
METVPPWPEIVKRLRFLSSLNQYELAQQLGVDQGTVSRWERGIAIPEGHTQKILRDRLHRLEPVIAPAAVESMPGLAMLYCRNQLGLCCAASQHFASAYEVRADQLRYQMIRGDWSDSVRNMWDAFVATDAWKAQDVAFATATVYRPDQKWSQFMLMPISGEPLLFGTGVEIPPPDRLALHEFELTITTKDNLVSI